MSTRVEAGILDITCPHWCTATAQEHVDDLCDQGGTVVHHLSEIYIDDDEGFAQAHTDDRLPAESFTVGLATVTRPSGIHLATPTLYLAGHEVTVKQAEEIAAAILEVVALAKI